MSINEGTYGDFANELQDEDQLDAHPYPGIEIGYDIQRDCGSGSYAEDGPRDVREDRPIMNGENMLGSAAMYGPTEIGGIEDEDAMGAVQRAVAKAAQAVKKAVVAKRTAPPNVAAKHAAVAERAVADAQHAFASAPYAHGGAVEIGEGLYSQDGGSEIGFGGCDDDELGAGLASQEGQTEIGAGEDTLGDDSLMQPFETFMIEPHRIGDNDEIRAQLYNASGDEEIGSAAMYGPTEIGEGLYSQDGGSEIGEGWAAADGQSEIGEGHYPTDGASELGALYPTNGLSEMGEGHYPTDGGSEIGAGWYAMEGASEIGKKAAIVKVVEKARDNRQPAPPMKAVDVDAPLDEDGDSFLSDIVVGATVAAPGKTEPFPLLSQLLLRAGVNVEPRIVRVDTEESYKAFRTEQSPALSEVKALSDRLEAHIADPNAHELDSEDIDDDIEDLVHLGEEAQATEAQKRVDLWMPKRFDGKVEAWKQGDTVCVSMAFPGRDGDVRICTSIEPMRKCIEEMCRHAGEAQVGHHVADVLPEMGCVLGAGTVMKEMAAAAPALLARPEAQMKLPFVVRIEPKTSPNLAALVMLAAGARGGNAQAANEWAKLASMSAPHVRSAMLEAAAVAKSATEG